MIKRTSGRRLNTTTDRDVDLSGYIEVAQKSNKDTLNNAANSIDISTMSESCKFSVDPYTYQITVDGVEDSNQSISFAQNSEWCNSKIGNAWYAVI